VDGTIGPTGAKGMTGPIGPAGPKGMTGGIGPIGSQGEWVVIIRYIILPVFMLIWDL
jgi:hypothetical protein